MTNYRLRRTKSSIKATVFIVNLSSSQINASLVASNATQINPGIIAVVYNPEELVRDRAFLAAIIC
jgi:hypothetical protein